LIVALRATIPPTAPKSRLTPTAKASKNFTIKRASHLKFFQLKRNKFLLALDSLLTQRFSEPFPPPVPLCGTTDGAEISFPNPFLISAPSVEKNQKRWQGKKSGGESKKQSFALSIFLISFTIIDKKRQNVQ